MISLIKALFYGYKWKYYDVWYNYPLYDRKEKYPVIFDKESKYIPPHKGLKVVMNHLKDGRPVYYKITHTIYRIGGGWLNDTDRINIDLVFSHIGKKESNG